MKKLEYLIEFKIDNSHQLIGGNKIVCEATGTITNLDHRESTFDNNNNYIAKDGNGGGGCCGGELAPHYPDDSILMVSDFFDELYSLGANDEIIARAKADIFG